MSRFGVFSLLLVLILDFGRSSTSGCNHVYDKLKVNEDDESSFRDKSQPSFRDLLSPLLTGLASEDLVLRKLYSSNDEFEKANLNKAEEHGFRNPLKQFFMSSAPKFGHRTLKKSSSAKGQQSSSKDKSRNKNKSDSKQSSTMMHSILEKVINSPSFCKYVQTVLQKVIDIAG